MSLNKRIRAKGRRSNLVERFAGLPIRCMSSENYTHLSPRGKSLLYELAFQYNGHNNGDLCITPKVMKARGWRSHKTLYAARDELISSGWIVITRHGGRNRCSLYALTYQPIDDCKGKHDTNPSTRALGFWELGRNPWHQQAEKAA